LVLDTYQPDLTWIWLNDPDATAHAHGMSAAATRESLTIVDTEIGRIEDSLRASGRLDRTNLIVTSDHGFSKHTGALRLGALAEPFARPLPDGSPDIVVAEGAIYLRGAADEGRRAALVSALQRHPPSARSSLVRSRPADSKDRFPARSRSTWLAGIIRAPATSWYPRIGPTRRMRRGLKAKRRRSASPGTAPRARTIFTTR
jgi:arylsulfatase A-like enzyme